MVDMGGAMLFVECYRDRTVRQILQQNTVPEVPTKYTRCQKARGGDGGVVDQDGITTGERVGKIEESIIMKNKFEYKFSDWSVIKLFLSCTDFFLYFIRELYKSVKRNKSHF